MKETQQMNLLPTPATY